VLKKHKKPGSINKSLKVCPDNNCILITLKIGQWAVQKNMFYRQVGTGFSY